ncbi:hypothetical protein GCM10009790_08950 [Georgenia ruanii]
MPLDVALDVAVGEDAAGGEDQDDGEGHQAQPAQQRVAPLAAGMPTGRPERRRRVGGIARSP